MNGKKQRKRIVTMLLIVALALNMGVAPRKSEAKNITIDEAKEYNVFTSEEVSQNGKYELEKISDSFFEYSSRDKGYYYWMIDKNGNSIKPKGSYVGKYKIYVGGTYWLHHEDGENGENIYVNKETNNLAWAWQKKSIYLVKEGDYINYAGTDKKAYEKAKKIYEDKNSKKRKKTKKINTGLVCTYEEPNENGILFWKDHKSKTFKVQAGYKAKMKINGKRKAKWKSSNKKIATINSNGLVTTKRKGSTTITGKIGGKTYKCKMKIRPVDIDYVYTGKPVLNDNLKSSPSNPIKVKVGTTLNVGFKKGTVVGIKGICGPEDTSTWKKLKEKNGYYGTDDELPAGANSLHGTHLWDFNQIIEKNCGGDMCVRIPSAPKKSKKLKKRLNKLHLDEENRLYANYNGGMIPREKMSDTIFKIHFCEPKKEIQYTDKVGKITFKAHWVLSATNLRTQEFTIYVKWVK